ncbi:MAG: FAD-binding oxidoreductase [Gammaproteobacteria bacterium]|nr:FAD-binding oxidoreductase [Gammaproteobacteria bacterium]
MQRLRPRAPEADEHPASWYLATARDVTGYPPLEESVSADVCVVGAGYTGLSAALHLAGRGYSVIVLEAHKVGWGASGRNGGQMGTGQRREESELEARFGEDIARQLFRLGVAGRDLVKDLVRRHDIDCDLTPGQILCASKPAHFPGLEERAIRLSRAYGYQEQSVLGRQELRTIVDSPLYHGGVMDSGAAHLHPLNYALGLARACVAAGVHIHESSRVTGYSGSGPVVVRTDRGEIRAQYLVLGCNAYLEGLEPGIADRIMPINNYLLATAPLGPQASRLIADPACVHDTFFVVNYFRLSRDGRLIFGGGETYSRQFPADMKGFVRRHMLRVFPQLESASIEYAWGGTLAISMNRLPHFGRLAPNVYFAHGYSGHGVSTATLAGQLIAEAVAGTAERFDVFAGLPPPRFPGGTLLRWPGLVLGMLWFALRDRL